MVRPRSPGVDCLRRECHHQKRLLKVAAGLAPPKNPRPPRRGGAGGETRSRKARSNAAGPRSKGSANGSRATPPQSANGSRATPLPPGCQRAARTREAREREVGHPARERGLEDPRQRGHDLGHVAAGGEEAEVQEVLGQLGVLPLGGGGRLGWLVGRCVGWVGGCLDDCWLVVGWWVGGLVGWWVGGLVGWCVGRWVGG
jgi:hypothetical protein